MRGCESSMIRVLYVVVVSMDLGGLYFLATSVVSIFSIFFLSSGRVYHSQCSWLLTTRGEAIEQKSSEEKK